MPLYRVKVRAKIASDDTEALHAVGFAFELTGHVDVKIEQPSVESAAAEAMEFLMGDEGSDDPLLALASGDGVEFDVVSVELAPQEPPV